MKTQEQIDEINRKFEAKLMKRREKYPMNHDWLEDYLSYFPDGEIILTKQELRELVSEYNSLYDNYTSEINFRAYEQDTIYG